MKVLEKGHIYEFNTLDKQSQNEPDVTLKFVNREAGTLHSGTQTQEVLRALIERTQHCDSCLRWEGNDLIVHHLRMALVLHEARALLRKTEKGIIQPEHIKIGEDGHFVLTDERDPTISTTRAFRERIVDDVSAKNWYGEGQACALPKAAPEFERDPVAQALEDIPF